MFAFALWDRLGSGSLLAQDRLGMKPLFLFHGPHTLVFEVRTKITASGSGRSREADEEALSSRPAAAMCPAPWAAFRGNAEAHSASIVENGAPTRAMLDPSISAQTARPREALIDELPRAAPGIRSPAPGERCADRRFSAAASIPCGRRVDVPTCHWPCRTLLVGFDEARRARPRWPRLGTDHHQLIVRPTRWRSIDSSGTTTSLSPILGVAVNGTVEAIARR